MKRIPFARREDYNSYMRAYIKKHYAENKGKYKAKQKRWLAKNPEYGKRYYLAHKNSKHEYYLARKRAPTNQ